MEITLTAQKADVLAEVDILTAYIGAKNGKFDTFPTLDADRELIEHFWRECCAFVTAHLSPILEADCSTPDCLQLTVRASDQAIVQSLNTALRGALARLILDRWQEIFSPGGGNIASPAINGQESKRQNAIELLSQILASAAHITLTTRRIPIF